jgi:Thiamine pyrophosphate enzyme, C-terminal TPP binding domain
MDATMLDRRDFVRQILIDRGDLLVVPGLGSATYDVAAAGDHPLNFYLWGALDGTAMIGLGLALARPDRRVGAIPGDGDLLMGLGSFATIGVQQPKNLAVVVLDNGHYGETGMQPSHTGAGVDFVAMALACRFRQARAVTRIEEAADMRAPACMRGPTPDQCKDQGGGGTARLAAARWPCDQAAFHRSNKRRLINRSNPSRSHAAEDCRESARSALVKEFVDFRALHPDYFKCQPAVRVDPFSNVVRINSEQSVRDKRECTGMKAERGVRRHANVFARKIAGKQRAGGSTDTRDAHGVLLRRKLFPLLLIEIDEPALVVGNLDGFRLGCRRGDSKQSRKEKPQKLHRGCPVLVGAVLAACFTASTISG